MNPGNLTIVITSALILFFVIIIFIIMDWYDHTALFELMNKPVWQ